MLEPVPPCICKRSRASRMFYRTRGGGELCCIKQCERCLGYLPMGPSDESPTNVQDEIRGAELADQVIRNMEAPTFLAQLDGWHNETVSVVGSAYREGELGRVIHDHEEDA